MFSVETQPDFQSPLSRGLAGPRVWLITALKADAEVLRVTRDEPSPQRRRPFSFVDLETGASPIAPHDIILLKTAAEPGITVMAESASLGRASPRNVAERLTALLETGPKASYTNRTVDLGLVRFIGHSKRDRRRGWSRSRFERSLDSLLCRRIAADPEVSSRVCRDILEDPGLHPESLFRGIAWRMRGDALAVAEASVEKRNDAVLAYREAHRAFRGSGAHAQATASARLASVVEARRLQLELWVDTPHAAVGGGGFGFHLCRFSGMQLPFAIDDLPSTERPQGLLRHCAIDTMRVEVNCIARWLCGAEASSHIASLLPPNPIERENGGADRRRYVEFVIDSEFATRAGLAGRVAAPSREGARQLFRLIPTSPSCRLEPLSAITTIGRPARFEVVSTTTRKHQVDLLVLTPEATPSNIRFHV